MGVNSQAGHARRSIVALVAAILFLFVEATAAAPILSEPFTFPDGPLVTVSSGKWTTHSGTANEATVHSGKLLLSQSASEDVNALLIGEPYASTAGALYASFTLNVTNLPSASGDYFAHFKGGSASGFRGKIFATRQGAAAGFYRIGLANLSNAPNAILNRDLAPNTVYTLITRCVLSNAQSTLWIDPSSENDASITDTTNSATLTLTSFAFRQTTGIGHLFVDDLLVGTNFNDVLRLTPPNILTQPQSRTVTEGGNATFSVSAIGTMPLQYQWQFNGDDLPGATLDTLSLTNIVPAQAGLYRVVVSNAAGTTNSDPAILSVQPLNVSGSAALSIVHYNVQGNFATNWTTNALQVQAIARKLQYLNPDIITLNEIQNGSRSEMTNWIKAFFPAYNLAVSPGTDGAIRSGVISRFPIVRTNSWLDGASLTNFGYEGTFTRDLFEAEIAVPELNFPLHVFTAHLKSGQDTDSSSRRAAEARAISNFFVTSFLTTNAAHPYLLTGDFNEDIARPPASNPQSIQTLVSTPTGLHLTTPLNPYSGSELTHSIQNTNGGLTKRYDYILPGGILFSNILSSEVFRTDLLPAPTPPLQTNDSMLASDHLPVFMSFGNPYRFEFTHVSLSNQVVSLTWETVPGRSYTLLSSADLTNWSAFATDLSSISNTLTFTTNIVADQIFLRGSRQP